MGVPDTSNKVQRPLKVLSLGLPRTGSASMARALELLGFENVHHAVKVLTQAQDWGFFVRAADATFPFLSTYNGKPVTRADWDEMLGPYDAVTDMAAVFGPQLVEAYPEAKVVLVKRNFDSWYRSVDEELIQANFGPAGVVFHDYVEPILDYPAYQAGRRIVLAMFGVDSREKINPVMARKAYDAHYERIRAVTPPERLLEFDLKQGWRPLCDFLGMDVPEEYKGREDKFPHVNDSEALREKIGELHMYLLGRLARRALPLLAGIVSVGAIWATRARWWRS